MTAVQVGWVQISTVDPPMRVLARLSDERPNVEAGYGGWEDVARPRRPPLTTVTSLPGLRLTLPVLLDAWSTGASIEKAISDLELMGRPVASDGEPPQVKIAAAGGAVPYQGRTWVVDSLTFGDALMNERGDRVRQQVTLSLLEYVADVYLTEQSAAARQRLKAAQAKTASGAPKKRVNAKAKPSSGGAALRATTATVIAGETLTRLAVRELGDCTRWVEIAELNGLRDPRYVPAGLVVRLP
jgi:hypothetical protein